MLLLDIDWKFIDTEYQGVSVQQYLQFAGIIIATLALKRPVAVLLTRISTRLAAKFSYMRHRNRIRTMLFKPIERLLLVVLFFVASEQITPLLDSISLHHIILSKKRIDITLGDVADHLFLFLFILFLTRVISRFIDFGYYLRMGKAQMEKNYSRMQLLPLFKEMAKLLLWIIAIFWIFGSVFQVNIPALITGLGIGGVAIALAGKETVENFFAAFTILSDKPFQTGDTIKLGDIEGVVERIGFRSTRLRSLDGSAHIIPNQNLVSHNLVNLSTRETRGMKVIANIRYGVDHQALTRMITELKTTLHTLPLVKDPVDVYIETFDKETFQLIIAYHLPHPLPDGAKLNSLKRDVNLRVFQVISGNGIIGTPVGTS